MNPAPPIHTLPAPEALGRLRSAAEGLGAAEARRRLGEFGPNRVERVRQEPVLLRLGREFVHFFALILWVAAGLCFFAEWREPGGGMARLGWAILAVILVNGLFAFWQEAKAARALEALEALLPREVMALRDGHAVRIPVTDVVPGDVLLLEDGDTVPADARVLEAFGLQVNAATLTGESLPLDRDAEATADPDPVRARNVVLAGTEVLTGQGRVLVYATGGRTEFGRIAGLTQGTRERRTTLQLEIAQVSRVIALMAVAIGAAFFLVGRHLGLGFWQNLIFAVGIIVANVPEGLLPTVSLALAMASQRMARRKALMRNLGAVETLGAATVICTDKTGTLTLNRMAARKLFLGGRVLDAEALGPEDAAAHGRFFEGAWLCQTLKGEGESVHGDPMEIALRDLGGAHLAAPPDWPQVDEVPFDANRRRLSLVFQGPEGRVLHAKGAPEVVLPLCTRVLGPQGPAPLDEAGREAFARAHAELAGQGLRVLAYAWRPVAADCPRERLEEDLVLMGLVALEDPPRPEVPAAVRTCREAGIRVLMVTGDHPLTALAIARRIGLVPADGGRVLAGRELRELDDVHLQLLLDERDLVFARLDPDQKHRIVGALQRKGEVVAVTGDGVNDAPALKAADIGIAMGRSGTDVAREAADMVLADDDFASIVAAIEEGRAVWDNLRKFLTYHMSSNCGELIPYLAFALFQVPLPLTVVQILSIDLGTDLVPALALGAERPEADLMRRPPRSRTQRLLDAKVLLRAYGTLGIPEGLAGVAACLAVLRAGGWRAGQALAFTDPLYLQATTACLGAIVALQMANVFLCRHEDRSAFHPGPVRNRLLWAGLGLEAAFLLALSAFPPLQALLGTARVPWAGWAVVPPFLLLMVALDEGRKRLFARA